MYTELSAFRAWALLPTLLPPTELINEPEVQDFMNWADELSADATQELLAELADLLPTLEVAQAAVVALCCGALVEQGGNPELAFTELFHCFQHLQALLDASIVPPEGAFRFTIMGLMTMLCRSAVNRRQIQQEPGLEEWLEQHSEASDHFYYLSGIMQISDEESLYVLFPEYGTGLEVSVSQINNGFHLLTLLQPLLLQQSAALGLRDIYNPLDEELIRYASGDTTASPPSEGQGIALFGWLNAMAYQGGPLDPLQMVWGEMPVRVLPRVHNRVVLLATERETKLKRSWDSSFFAVLHGAHRPQVQVQRVLTTNEVAATLHAIHPLVVVPATAPTEPLPPLPWWKRLLGSK